MYFFDYYNEDFKNIFPKHNILVYKGTNPSNEQLEILKILKKNPFKKIHLSNTLSDIENLIKTTNISIIFFDIEKIQDIQIIRELIQNKEIKIFLTVNNITNELFKLKPDEFIYNPSLQKEMTVLKLILKNLILIENSLKHKSNEIKITEQQKSFDKIFELLSNNSLITKTDIDGKIIYANEIFQKISGFTKNVQKSV